MLISLFCRQIIYSHEKESVGGLSQGIKAKTGVIRQKEESETVDSLGTVNLVCTIFCVNWLSVSWQGEVHLGRLFSGRPTKGIKDNNFHCVGALQKALGLSKKGRSHLSQRPPFSFLQQLLVQPCPYLAAQENSSLFTTFPHTSFCTF